MSQQQRVDADTTTLLVDLYEDSISQTRAGWIIPTMSGSLSFLSSALIIYIITRSQRTIYTATYHHIMSCLCLSDMLSSFAVLLTTLPMPKDVNEIYNFDGNSYGTALTCVIQAASYALGNRISYISSIFLSLYYVLTIRYNVTHRVVSRYVEPLGLIIYLGSLIGTWTYFTLERFNPVPYISWCVVGNYPYGCYEEDGESCIRGKAPEKSIMKFMCLAVIGVAIQFIFMALIISSVCKGEKERARIAQLEMEARDEERTLEDVEQVAKYRESQNLEMRDTNIIALQAFLYFISFTTTFSFIPQITSKSQSAVLQVITLILKPLQGFFNAAIFIYHKVYLLRQGGKESKMSICDAIVAVIRDPGKVPEILLELPEDAHVPVEYLTQVERSLELREESDGDFPAQTAESLNHAKNNGTRRVDKSEGSTEEPTFSHALSIGANDDSVLSSTETVKKNNWGWTILEEDSRLSYAETESAADSRLEEMTSIKQFSRNYMVTRDEGSSNLSEGNDWSAGGAESFADDSADSRCNGKS